MKTCVLDTWVIPQHVRGGGGVQRVRVVVAALGERGVVVVGGDGALQVESVLEEGGTRVAEVPAARPPPARHGAQRGRRHQVAESQRLLQNRPHLLLEIITYNVSIQWS